MLGFLLNEGCTDCSMRCCDVQQKCWCGFGLTSVVNSNRYAHPPLAILLFFYHDNISKPSRIANWLDDFASRNRWTLVFVASVFSSDILRSFCFFDRIEGSVLKPCAMMARLTPTRSKVDHAKTSLFRFRQDNNISSSTWLRSSLISTVWFSTDGHKVTFLASSLLWIGAFALRKEATYIMWSWDKVPFYVPGCLLISIDC